MAKIILLAVLATFTKIYNAAPVNRDAKLNVTTAFVINETENYTCPELKCTLWDPTKTDVENGFYQH